MDDKNVAPNDPRTLQIPGRSQPPAVPTRPEETHAGAASVARAQVENIYQTNPPHQTEAASAEVQGVYNRQHGDSSTYDWRQYHAAWQNYYQQYYHRYYAQHLHNERQKLLSEKATDAASAPAVIVGKGKAIDDESPAAKLRRELLGKVQSRYKKFRRSSHFMPIATALAVGFVFFLFQFNKVLAAQVNAYVSPSQTISDNVIVDPNASVAVGPEPRLVIPKINVDVPIVYGLTSLDNDSTQKALEDGVVHYPIPGANSLPGQTGNNVILGHSSNDVFKPGDYKFAFVLLERLEPGDPFYIHHEGTRYIYNITKKEVIMPNEVSKLVLPTDKPVTSLVTCTPIGTDEKRLVVYADQITPDPSKAEKVQPGEGQGSRVNIPGNEPSFLERLFGF